MLIVPHSFRAFFLLSLFPLGLQAQGRGEGNDESASEGHELGIDARLLALPEIEVLKSVPQPRTQFTGTFHSEYTAKASEKSAGMSLEEEEAYLSWEVASPRTGQRLEKFVRIRVTGKIAANNRTTKAGRAVENQLNNGEQKEIETQLKARAASGISTARYRGKRNIYGRDSRQYIPSRTFARRFPFASVVKLSTGCTGTLVSPRHVLTAAHCIHDQKDYVSRYKDLKVGLIRFRRHGFEWYKVNESFLPNGWLIGNPDIASKFDYALLKLADTTHPRPYFKLGISENKINGEKRRIHFTAFEDDKPSNTLWYRHCRIQEVDAHVMYHYCDARPGSSGSGVYLWNYDADEKIWERKLIGVFSGNRWRYYKNEWWKKPVNFNAAIRINSAKYTQICQWLGSYAKTQCKQKYYKT